MARRARRSKDWSDEELAAILTQAAAGAPDRARYLEDLVEAKPNLLSRIAALAAKLDLGRPQENSQAASFFERLERTAARDLRDALLAGRTDPLRSSSPTNWSRHGGPSKRPMTSSPRPVPRLIPGPCWPGRNRPRHATTGP